MDEKYMNQAISLAKKWYWKTLSNPLVWAVILKNNKVIWKWYHKKYWNAHAEINAINSVKNKNDLRWSTLYVTLEPCNHHWKTPPCTQAIIDSWISKVIIWLLDPNKQAWWWAKLLEKNWIKISILENKSKEINKEFFNIHEKKQCFVMAKIASSLDGAIALNNWESKWITWALARKDWRHLRWEVDWILVWINTVLIDNPTLTTRIRWKNNPTRIVLDSNLQTPLESNILNKDAKTIIITTTNNGKSEEINKMGHEVIELTWKKVDLGETLKKLHWIWLKRILIEWGPTIITAFLKKWLIDKIIHYQSPTILWSDSKKMTWPFNLTNLKNSIKLELIKRKNLWNDLRQDFNIANND